MNNQSPFSQVYFFFDEVSSQIFVLFFPFSLGLQSSLYILYACPLSDLWFVATLFVLLSVTFEEYTFLILIKSDLLLFFYGSCFALV